MLTSVSASFEFIVTADADCKASKFTAPDAPENVEYFSGESAKQVNWNNFAHDMNAGCVPNIQYTLSATRIGSGDGLPSNLIEFQPFFNRLNIEGTFETSGTFEVTVTGELTDDNGKQKASFTFELTIVG